MQEENIDVNTLLEKRKRILYSIASGIKSYVVTFAMEENIKLPEVIRDIDDISIEILNQVKENITSKEIIPEEIRNKLTTPLSGQKLPIDKYFALQKSPEGLEETKNKFNNIIKAKSDLISEEGDILQRLNELEKVVKEHNIKMANEVGRKKKK